GGLPALWGAGRPVGRLRVQNSHSYPDLARGGSGPLNPCSSANSRQRGRAVPGGAEQVGRGLLDAGAGWRAGGEGDMTEEEGLAGQYPQRMIPVLQGRTSPRKLRLLACACCRRVWHLMKNRESRRAVDVAERFADGKVTDSERAEARRRTHGVFRVG